MPRNDDISLILAKAKMNGMLPDVKNEELDAIQQYADSLFGNDRALSAFYSPKRVRSLGAFIRRLVTNKLSSIAVVQGDSTGSDPWEWVHEFFNWLALQYPNLTFAIRAWSDANQGYGTSSYLRLGNLGDRYLDFSNANGGYFSVPDSAATSLTGDLDIQVKLSFDTGLPTAAQTLASKNGAAGQRSWWLDMNVSGTVVLALSTDGTAFVSKVSTASAPILADTPIWIRATLDADNGAAGYTVTFYTSSDGNTWTQLGAPVVTATPITLFDSTQAAQFLGRGGGAMTIDGKGYAMRLYGVIGGSNPVIDIDADAMPSAGTTFLDYAGNVITIFGTAPRIGSIGVLVLNASASGQAIAYSNDATRFAKQVPVSANLHFISYGHNEGSTFIDYAAPYKTLMDSIKTKSPDAGIIALTQNPQTAPRTSDQIECHAIRFDVVAEVASSRNAEIIDIYTAFIEDSRGLTALVSGDGVHATEPIGNDLWTDTVINAFKPWIKNII